MEHDQIWLELVKDNFDYILWIAGADGHLLRGRSTVCAYIGQIEEDLQETEVIAAIHPEDTDRVMQIWKDALITKLPFETECRLRRYDGVYRLFSLRAVPAFEANNLLREWVGICTDITERRQLEELSHENEKRFHILFEHAAVGIAHVSIDGQCLRANQKLCDILGYTHEELLEQTFQDVTYPDDIEGNLANIRRLLADEIQTYVMEKRYFRKDGSLVWANLTVSLVRDTAGIPQYFISIVEDISERKRAEEEKARLLLREQAARAKAEATAEKLTILQSITDTALARLKLKDLLDELIQRISSILKADAVAILLPTEDQQDLKVQAALGLEQNVIKAIAIPIGTNHPDHILLGQDPIIVNDLSDFKNLASQIPKKIRSLVAAPLLIEGQAIGLICVGARSISQFNQDDALLLQRAADRIALAIDHARLYEAEQRARTEATERALQYETIFETIADGVYVYNNERQILHANTAAKELFGMNSHSSSIPHATTTSNVMLSILDEHGQLLPDDEQPTSRILHGETLKGANAVDILVQNIKGDHMQLSVSGAPLYDMQGHIIGGVSAIHDVTERRNLEYRTQNTLERLLEMAGSLVTLPEGIGKIDVVGHRLAELIYSILSCQHVRLLVTELEAQELGTFSTIGISGQQEPSQMAGQQQSQSYPCKLTPELLSRLYLGEVQVLNTVPLPFCNQPNLCSANVIVPMGRGDRLVGILMLAYRNTSSQYTQDEARLVSAVAKLSALVIERQRLLSERAEAHGREVALREANYRMEEFLGIASHELRTPLTTIKANVQLARRRLKIGSPQLEMIPHDLANRISTTQGMLERAERQVNVLNRLVNDMIDISRIQTGRLQLHLHQKPCNLVTIVQDATQAQCKFASERQITVKILANHVVSVIADPDRIAQVITNYITNALKYSATDKPVVIQLEVEGQNARVAVIDKGPGLSREEQEHIWDCFYQAPSVNVLSGSGIGLGLGLYISQTLIERHHGQAGVQSILGEGSTFWFTLPLV